MTPRRLLLLLLAATLSFAAPVSSFANEDTSVTPRDEDSPPVAKPAKKKPAKKKKTFDYDRSKYKSREPSEVSAYKFNDKGEPIDPDAKKKAAKKKKKRSEPPEAGAGESCGSEDSCIEKKTEADAL